MFVLFKHIDRSAWYKSMKKKFKCLIGRKKCIYRSRDIFKFTGTKIIGVKNCTLD